MTTPERKKKNQRIHIGREGFPHLFIPAVDLGFDRIDGNTQFFGYFGIFLPFEDFFADNQATLIRQTFQCPGDPVGKFLIDGSIDL